MGDLKAILDMFTTLGNEWVLKISVPNPFSHRILLSEAARSKQKCIFGTAKFCLVLVFRPSLYQKKLDVLTKN